MYGSQKQSTMPSFSCFRPAAEVAAAPLEKKSPEELKKEAKLMAEQKKKEAKMARREARRAVWLAIFGDWFCCHGNRAGQQWALLSLQLSKRGEMLSLTCTAVFHGVPQR